MITFERVSSLLSYDPRTGALTWKARDDAKWNGRWAGKAAGSVYGRGYRYVSFDGRQHLAHRIAWLLSTGSLPEAQIDHINGDKTDNHIANLRQATNRENLRNRGANRNSVSGIKGVWFDPRGKRWVAGITVDGKSMHLGRFRLAEDARGVYKAAADRLHGAFARSEREAR